MTIAGHPAIDALTETNRLVQLDLLGQVADRLTTCPAVTHLMVRGSLARGDSDRLSDVDPVVGIHEAEYLRFVQVHDALAQTELGAIMPGWPDKIVPRMGGLGYVHLVEHDGQLHQLDLYLAPAGRIAHITAFTRGHLIHTAGRPDTDPAARKAAQRYVTASLEAPLTCAQLLVESLVLAWMIRKRIARGQQFMAYAETTMFVTAARSLIRTALHPTTAFYGWYHLESHVGATPLGRACLREFTELMRSDPVPTRDSLARMVDRLLAVAHRAAPQTVDELRLSIDAFLHHFEQN